MKTPVQLKRCGAETRLVVGDAQEDTPHADSIKAIRTALNNASKCNQVLLEGGAKTLTELAAKENHDVRYLIDLMHLASRS